MSETSLDFPNPVCIVGSDIVPPEMETVGAIGDELKTLIRKLWEQVKKVTESTLTDADAFHAIMGLKALIRKYVALQLFDAL